MGEYIRIDGQTVKLGTCEDLYWIRRDELERLIDSGAAERCPGNMEPRRYWEDDQFRYRFPFPDEDGQDWTQWMKRDWRRGLLVGVPRALAEMQHGDVWRSVSADGAYNVNVALPCPAAEAFGGFKSSAVPEHFPLSIQQQRRIEGEMRVIVACGWCGRKVRLDATEAGKLADHLNTIRSDGEYWREIARRIMAGYKLAKEAR